MNLIANRRAIFAGKGIWMLRSVRHIWDIHMRKRYLFEALASAANVAAAYHRLA